MIFRLKSFWKYEHYSITIIQYTLLLTFFSCQDREFDNPFDNLDPSVWAPQNFSVADVSITEKKLSWTYGDYNIDGFKLDRKKGDEEWQVEYQMFAKETKSWNDTEVVPDGSDYQYRIYAYAGNNLSTQLIQSTTALFTAPSDLLIMLLSPTSVNITWHDNSNGEEGFKIDRKTGSGNWQVVFASTEANITNYQDNTVNLANNEYSYRVYAYYNDYSSAFIGKTIGQISCGINYTFNHAAGLIAPVSKTVTYGTVETTLTGITKCWITQNLGADHQAGSATDATEASAGWYWQFNRKQGFKHDGTTRTPNTTWISDISENSNWQASNDPCALLLGNGWRLPTVTEWDNAVANGGWGNYTNTYASVMRLHAAGTLGYSDGSLYSRGSYGYYWSSSQYDNSNGWALFFGSGSCTTYSYGKAYGQSSRCLRD
jgi:hypothetical protein